MKVNATSSYSRTGARRKNAGVLGPAAGKVHRSTIHRIVIFQPSQKGIKTIDNADFEHV